MFYFKDGVDGGIPSTGRTCLKWYAYFGPTSMRHVGHIWTLTLAPTRERERERERERKRENFAY